MPDLTADGLVAFVESSTLPCDVAALMRRVAALPVTSAADHDTLDGLAAVLERHPTSTTSAAAALLRLSGYAKSLAGMIEQWSAPAPAVPAVHTFRVLHIIGDGARPEGVTPQALIFTAPRPLFGQQYRHARLDHWAGKAWVQPDAPDAARLVGLNHGLDADLVEFVAADDARTEGQRLALVAYPDLTADEVSGDVALDYWVRHRGTGFVVDVVAAPDGTVTTRPKRRPTK